jgi:hypothetical protein
VLELLKSGRKLRAAGRRLNKEGTAAGYGNWPEPLFHGRYVWLAPLSIRAELKQR